MASEAQRHIDALNVLERGVGVAIGNLEAHIQALDQHSNEVHGWTDQVKQQHEELLRSLGNTLPLLQRIPASNQFPQLLPLLDRRLEAPLTQPKHSVNLASFVSRSRVDSYVKSINTEVEAIDKRFRELNTKVEDVLNRADALFDSVEKDYVQSVMVRDRDVSQLMEEVDVVTKKIQSDCDHVLQLPASQQSVAHASKMALTHTKNYLPSLSEYCLEMGDVLRRAVEQRRLSCTRALQNMRNVAVDEALFARVDAAVKSWDIQLDNSEAHEVVNLLIQLPFVYGALLVETVRRREWAEKIRSESANLAEDIAGYRQEEERRRKKWLKNIGHLVNEEGLSGSVLNFELNLKAEEKELPDINRDDVQEYLTALKDLPGLEEVLDELKTSFRSIDDPSRRQSKTARNFKNGSLHEATSGKGSFFLRDNEDIKSLREANRKLEEDVRGQKSRVRKLEDLLYKQSQATRSASGNAFPNADTFPAEGPAFDHFSPSSNHTEPFPHLASTPSRRSSLAKPNDEKTLARRVVDLEAQLLEERQKRQEAEEVANSRREFQAQLQHQVEESRSTKKDLMANLDAQQREFASERRLLEKDIEKYKSKTEEVEDELDRVLGSRDNEKASVEERVRCLETDLEQSKRDLADLQYEVKTREETEEDQNRALRAVHARLDAGNVQSKSRLDLINSLDEFTEKSKRVMVELQQNLNTITSERDELRASLEQARDTLSSMSTRVSTLEFELTTSNNEVATEKARSRTLADELEDGRLQLRNLRAKFAEGETGSDSLRQRLEDQASRASNLAAELAETQSHVNSLDVELTSLQLKHYMLLTSSNNEHKRLEQRSNKAKELTSRVIAFYQELLRLLDSLGLSVNYRDGSVVIQRSSKLASASAILPSLQNSTADSSISPSNLQPFDSSLNSESVSWMHADSLEEENTRFTRLVEKLNELNLNTFCEAVVKLRRDVEWTGKKWKMEARNYRDKYQKAQSDAHEKIAYRSFKEGDLALFLPTRNQATRPWAAFNVGAPHYFLREQDTHRLQNREWLVARISKVEERIVDLSKTLGSTRNADQLSISGTSEGGVSFDDENPFELSDGLRWYLLDAYEEKPGAPSTPGLGKSTVASAHVDVKGSIRMKKAAAGNDASGKLNKSLESRRSSSNSKRGSISGGKEGVAELGLGGEAITTEANAERLLHPHGAAERPSSRSSAAAASLSAHGSGLDIKGKAPAHTLDEVRIDQLLGP